MKPMTPDELHEKIMASPHGTEATWAWIEYRTLYTQHQAVVEVLKEIEWNRPEQRWGEEMSACPLCFGLWVDGHEKGCKLRAALELEEK